MDNLFADFANLPDGADLGHHLQARITHRQPAVKHNSDDLERLFRALGLCRASALLEAPIA